MSSILLKKLASLAQSVTEPTKRIFKINPLAVALAAIPVAVAMTACTTNVELGGAKDDALASREATSSKDVIDFPDAVPSTADGGVYWKQNNCASCHGEDGKGVAGQCEVDLTNAEWMRARKPIEQYRVITFGEGEETKTPVTSALSDPEHIAEAGSKEVPVVRKIKHEPFHDKLNKRQRWDLVFYSRSFAAPLLTVAKRMEMKAVFGANCAVCHGTRGAGDGPLNKGLVLQPAPANFTQFDRFYDRTDEQIWDHIANGIKWEGMPNFLGKEDKGNKVKFDAEYIWQLVQFVRNFHEDSDYALEDPKKAAYLDSLSKKTARIDRNSTIVKAESSAEKSKSSANRLSSKSTKEIQ